MLKTYNSNVNNYSDLNTFFSHIKKNKKYFNQLKIQNIFLNKTKEKSYKILPLNLKKKNRVRSFLITYTLIINFSRSNTVLSIMDCLGNIKFFYSAGSFGFKGRQKISRSVVLKSFYKLIISKLKFLKGKPITVHYKNVGLNNLWLLRKLKQKFFIVSVKNFNVYPYNGCRRKKVRRKK